MSPPWINLIMFLMTYQLYFLFCTHTAIAFNRYTAFLRPTMHRRLWSDRSMKLFVLVVALLPLPGAATRLFYTTSIVDTDDANGFKLVVNPSWAPAVGDFESTRAEEEGG
ncbi:hypothetical protein AAVH_21929 [Aphelenchoides avenae]|nr:hypothetical protein AAVH_21929 [Aphelenchus avenae]